MVASEKPQDLETEALPSNPGSTTPQLCGRVQPADPREARLPQQ